MSDSRLLPGEREEFEPGQRVLYRRPIQGGYLGALDLRGSVSHKTPSGRYSVRLDDGRNVVVSGWSLLVEET